MAGELPRTADVVERLEDAHDRNKGWFTPLLVDAIKEIKRLRKELKRAEKQRSDKGRI